MVSFTTFDSLTATDPQFHNEDWDAFVNRFKSPQKVLSKKLAHIYYSFAEYKNGGKRGLDDIIAHHGIIIDMDVKHNVTGPLTGVDYINQMVAPLASYRYLWHTTSSYKDNRPSFRILIPFADKIKPADYARVFDRVSYLLEDQPSIDICSMTPSQIYAGPCVIGLDQYHYASSRSDEYMNPDRLAFRPTNYGLESAAPTRLTDQQKIAFISEAIRYVDPDIAYRDWVKVGMALKTELGDAKGFELWDWWSRNGKKYTTQKDLALHWKTFNKSLVTGATIVGLAQDIGFGGTFDGKGYLRDLLAKETHTVSLPEATATELDDTSPVFDDHAIFKDWGEFNYAGDIHDLSPYPLLDRLNQAFLMNTITRRGNMRLASVLSVAGHILPHHYACPYETPLYVWGLLPTGTGKAAFKRTILQLMDHFRLSAHVSHKIGSVQGLVKSLIKNSGLAYNLVDEIADYYKIMRSQKGDSRRAEILSVFKDIYGGNAPVASDIIKNEDVESIASTSVSMFWAGPDDVFKYMGVDEFTGGAMNRILVFVEECAADFGANDRDELARLAHVDIQLPDFSDIQYRFGDKIEFGRDVEDYALAFQQMARGKYRELAGDLRANILTRATENLLKLCVLTCDKTGHISLDAAKHMAGILIHCFKGTSYCVNKHFEVSQHQKDVSDVVTKLIKLRNTKNDHQIYFRELSQSLQKIPRMRIDEALKRLSDEQAVSVQDVVRRNNKTKLITIAPSINYYLTQ